MLFLLHACAPAGIAILAPQGVLEAPPAHHEFGAVPYDAPAQHTWTLTNVGDANLPLVLSLDDATFALSVDGLDLAPGQSTTFQVTFTPPADLAVRTTQLLLDGSRTSYTADLSGQTDPDGDDDGHDHPALGGDDCDDGDPGVSPAAAEVWYDDVDQDCDGNDTDQDRDGHDHPSMGGDDCDDTSADRFPGNPEVWYDGVDQDCDGNDTDRDLDGYDALEVGGNDCDDQEATVFPLAPEGDDLVDQDCDGRVDEDFVQAGDVFITEALPDPKAAPDPAGQYLEVVNASSRDVSVLGWDLRTAGWTTTVDADVVLPAGARRLLCADGRSTANGGLSCAWAWGTANALQAGYELLRFGPPGKVVDQLEWTSSFDIQAGKALNLDPDFEDADANDAATSWCPATTVAPSGDRGTPGEVNDEC